MLPWLSAREIDGCRRCRPSCSASPMSANWASNCMSTRGDAVRLFLALEEAGKPFGIGHYGAYAANSMRLEKGYRGWGMDLTTERSPLETGLRLPRQAGGPQTSSAATPCWQARSPTGTWCCWRSTPTARSSPSIPTRSSRGARPSASSPPAPLATASGKSLALAFLREPEVREGLTVKMLGRERHGAHSRHAAL